MTTTRFEILLKQIEPHITKSPMHAMPISSVKRLFITPIGIFAVGLLGMHLKSRTWVEQFHVPERRVCHLLISLDFLFQNPPHGASLFNSYKEFFSIVLLAIVDANNKFVFINIGGYGREGDAGLFNRWTFSKRLQNPYKSYEEGGLELPYEKYLPSINVSSPHVFLGDLAFPLGKNLMKPYTYDSANKEIEFELYHCKQGNLLFRHAVNRDDFGAKLDSLLFPLHH